MARIIIEVDVEPENEDRIDSTGLSIDAYERLTDPMSGPLGWLGQILDVKKA